MHLSDVFANGVMMNIYVMNVHTDMSLAHSIKDCPTVVYKCGKEVVSMSKTIRSISRKSDS